MAVDWTRLEALARRRQELEILLADPSTSTDPRRLKELSREFSQLEEPAALWKEYRRLVDQMQSARSLLEAERDPSLRRLAQEEIAELQDRLESLQQRALEALVPVDPLDGKNIFLEIRAGTGGEEAALFAGDLLRMYTRYAERKGWKVELVSLSEGDLGGVKEAVLAISGKEVYGHLRWESGGHRVQRIPVTEAGGRIHTSAATVAVLPEAEETEIEIQEKDLRIDVFRSSGKGGQSVNTADSAVRITHLPSGIVVSCQDERSQLRNKEKALRILRARLLEMEKQKQAERIAQERRSQVGTGDRSDRIRTYNFPQNRVTDHQINYTSYNLERILDGELDELIEKLRFHARTQGSMAPTDEADG